MAPVYQTASVDEEVENPCLRPHINSIEYWYIVENNAVFFYFDINTTTLCWWWRTINNGAKAAAVAFVSYFLHHGIVTV